MIRPNNHRLNLARFLVSGDVEPLQRMVKADWRKNLWWLDRSGLALPLAVRLESTALEHWVPKRIYEGLQQRLFDNECRMESMFHLFHQANESLAAAGVNYCCVKGFSLVPHCFAHMRERHQVDIDFLITPSDTVRARIALESLGYQLIDDRSSGELRFMRPSNTYLGRNAWLYQQPECVVIELHVRAWEPESDTIGFPLLPDFLDATESRVLHGISFPSLKTSYQFVYLLLHVFRHLAGSWVRLISLYELAVMLRSFRLHASIWNEVVTLIESDPTLISAAALVLELVRRVFDVDYPDPLNQLCTKGLSTDSRLWIESYADAWLYSAPPGNKLALLVQEQFCPDAHAWKRYVRQRLFPFRTPPALSSGAHNKINRRVWYRIDDTLYKFSRLWYHFSSNLQLLWAYHGWTTLHDSETVDRYHLASEA